MHSRRARPTLRVLAQDLTADWASPLPRRLVEEGRLDELHPLSELPHPIISKAVDCFSHDATTDNYVGLIASSTSMRLMEIKVGQWRGGVWLDEQTGVHWLVVAGLAKGNHEDHDDFYQRLKRENAAGDAGSWLPTDVDHRLLKRETAARVITEWELDVQQQMLGALREIHAGGSVRIDIPHPIAGRDQLATLAVTVSAVRENNYQADEIELQVLAGRAYAGGRLLWQSIVRALITLSPPEQGWDRYKESFSTIAEPGYFTARVAALEAMTSERRLVESEPGRHAHYTHREHLAGNTIDGKAVRALCGVYFVPTQDHAPMPRCPECDERLAELPS